MTATCSVCEVHAESTFKIEGMHCREEVAILERRLKSLRGLEDFTADLLGQRLRIKYDAAKLSTATITDAVADTGMRAWLEHEEPILSAEGGANLARLLMWTSALALAAGLLLKAANAPAGFWAPWLVISLTTGAAMTVRKAISALRVGTLDINVLMIVAACGAIAIGEWAEAATVVFLFAVARTLEARTFERARRAIRALMDLTPTEALVREGLHERRVSAELIRPGATIVIRPGEKIPLDGDVLAGSSAVNQAPITGESLPVDKAPGDPVFAGTINGLGALEVRVTRLRRDTTLARIIHLVERAQAQRAPAQTFVERFARVYTPAVIVLAIGLTVVPPLMWHLAWQTWFYRALVLLVVACPCALVISTPVSIVAALAGAARKGVLIKGGAHLERSGAVRCVAFDKTGTLTRGLPEVVEVVSLNGADVAVIAGLAASVERRSAHPIARAIVEHARAIHVATTPAENVSALSGRGAEGQVDGSRVVLGNHRLFEERRLCSPEIHDRLAELAATGRTPILVARDDRPIGIIAVADRPREGARDAVELLRRQGVRAIVLLTGDSRSTADSLAADLGLDEVRAGLLPEQKVGAIGELRSRYGPVAMVGDGVNDAPALAAADLGIAMGVAGCDAALETADVALMGDELLKIPYTFRLSRATLRNVKMNVAVSLIMKAAFVAAAIAGVATLWMAVMADTGASVLVIANALRLLRAD